MTFFHLGTSDHFVVSVSINFPSYSQWDASFLRIAYAYSRVIWTVLVTIWEMFHGRIFLNSVLLLLLTILWVGQVGANIYISNQKYQVKPHSSPWFSAACASAIVHKNHSFRLYQKDESAESRIKLWQASNRCKRVLEATKLLHRNKTKESITSQNQDFVFQ